MIDDDQFFCWGSPVPLKQASSAPLQNSSVLQFPARLCASFAQELQFFPLSEVLGTGDIRKGDRDGDRCWVHMYKWIFHTSPQVELTTMHLYVNEYVCICLKYEMSMFCFFCWMMNKLWIDHVYKKLYGQFLLPKVFHAWWLWDVALIIARAD